MTTMNTLGDRLHYFETRQKAGAYAELAVAGFELLELLGKGTFGRVFRARDAVLGREVALKVTHAKGDDRDLREARALAAVRHPNVVAVYGAEVVEDSVVTSMELLDGLTLDAWIAMRPKLDTVLRVLRQVGEGLAAIHAAGLVHKDVKPANILVDRGTGRAVLVDLGLAHSEGAAGSKRWMAPEVQAGQVPDQRSDQYSFALVVRWALEHAGGQALAREFVTRALAERPGDRWPRLVEGLKRIPPRNPWPWRAIVAVAVLIGCVLGVWASPRSCGGSIVPAWVPAAVAMDEALELARDGKILEAHEIVARARQPLADANPAWAAEATLRVSLFAAATGRSPSERVTAAMLALYSAESFEDAGNEADADSQRLFAAALLRGFDDEAADAIERSLGYSSSAQPTLPSRLENGLSQPR